MTDEKIKEAFRKSEETDIGESDFADDIIGNGSDGKYFRAMGYYRGIKDAERIAKIEVLEALIRGHAHRTDKSLIESMSKILTELNAESDNAKGH